MDEFPMGEMPDHIRNVAQGEWKTVAINLAPWNNSMIGSATQSIYLTDEEYQDYQALSVEDKKRAIAVWVESSKFY